MGMFEELYYQNGQKTEDKKKCNCTAKNGTPKKKKKYAKEQMFMANNTCCSKNKSVG